MKTLEELYGEIMKSEALNKAFAEALMDNKVGEFLKAHGCESDVEGLAAFLRERGRQAKSVELADEALDKVSGGAYSYVGGDICQNCWNLDVKETCTYNSYFPVLGHAVSRYNCRCRTCGHTWTYITGLPE